MNLFVSTVTFLVSCATALGASLTNLAANGSFEQARNNSDAPDFWIAAGNRNIKQTIALDVGWNGGRCARLDCVEFSGGGGDAHAMICQTGHVKVRKNQWYRIAFRAKSAGIKGGVDVALLNRRPWKDLGLNEVFIPSGKWEQFEFRFQARDDLSGFASRLQFWFKSTGTLWLDDVELHEISGGLEWFPQLASEGVKNLLPNSSFECGTANWGSFTYGLKGWAGNLYRLEGKLNLDTAWHGDNSFKISSESPPTFYFDYYEAVRQPVRRVLVANKGWIKTKPGETLTFSAYVRADADATKVQMTVNEAPDHLQRKEIIAGREWQRHEFTFTTTARFLFVAIGPDFEDAEIEKSPRAVWIDALQLERGEKATDFQPRESLESFIETENHVCVASNLALTIRAYNDTKENGSITGRVEMTDFFDRKLLERDRILNVPPHSSAVLTVAGPVPLQMGFFRTTWTTIGSTQSVRNAVISPEPKVNESALGMNHAYPWDFLVRLAGDAGIRSWRDWSAKWDTIESRKGEFDFRGVDPQMERVIVQGGQITALLPFPSASWSSSARKRDLEKWAREDQNNHFALACMPKNVDDFGNYAAKVAEHFRNQPAVTHFQILNEPLFTDYALPSRLGYTLDDYLRLVRSASAAVRSANPNSRIIGGIGAGPESDLTRQFVAQGGLQMVDILDLHLYDPPLAPETFENAFKSLADLMRANGQTKPIWITEWGCYADDDPACLPQNIGDTAMNRCRWPSERAAAENLVKFTAVSFAHGVRKIFLHAGVCGAINGPDSASVLFEYGGAPRKIYAAAAALTSILGVPSECIKTVNAGGVRAYVFRNGTGFTAVTWSGSGKALDLKIPDSIVSFDMMGNEMPGRDLSLGQSPIYLQAQSPEILIQALGRP